MNRKFLTVSVITALAMGTSSPVLAQAADEADNALLEEVIVTATKREQSIYDVPIAVSAFTEDILFRQGIVDLQAAAIHAPIRHGRTNRLAVLVLTDAAHQARGLAEGLQVPGHVEGRAAKDGTAIGKAVEEHLAEQLEG